MGRVSVRLMPTDDPSRVGGLRVTGYAQFGQPVGGGAKNRYLGMVSYKSKMVTLAAEFATTQDSTFSATAPVKPLLTGQVIAGYGILKVPNSQVGFLARVDLFNPDTQNAHTAANQKQTRVIGGIFYQLNPHLRLLADVDADSYEISATGGPAGQYAQATQLLIQSQITF
jgi:hypothetical protein